MKTKKNQQTHAKPPLQGRSFKWDSPDPWPDHVNGDQLLQGMADTFSRYLILPDGAAEAMALWSLYTWVFDAFDVSPILAVTSPVKRCGKTTTITLMNALTSRPFMVGSITSAALFRFVELEQPTLIVDEADRFLLKNVELQGILNAGHTRMTAKVLRSVGDDYEPRCFSTWCPKAIALIGKMPDTLHDRSIEIRMRRKLECEKVEHSRGDLILKHTDDLRRQAMRWAADKQGLLGESDPSMPQMNDRAADNWRPLFAVAAAAGGQWPDLAARAVAQLQKASSTSDEDDDLLLLSDIREAFRETNHEAWITSSELANRLKNDDTRPWSEWSGPNEAAREIAKRLRSFDIRPIKFREGQRTSRGYVRQDFEDAFERYLPKPKAPQGPEQAEHVEQMEDDAEIHNRPAALSDPPGHLASGGRP